MPKSRPPYPAEFRQEAVRVLRSGVPLMRLAEESGDSPSRRCVTGATQDEADRGERSDVLSTDERARLRELERENRVLRQEREILKRAAAFFARESDRP